MNHYQSVINGLRKELKDFRHSQRVVEKRLKQISTAINEMKRMAYEKGFYVE